jgi:hypothetical protein
MTQKEELSFYYRISDIVLFNNISKTNLYNNLTFSTPVGTAISNATIVNEYGLVSLILNNKVIEDITYFLKDGCIFYTSSLENQDIDNIPPENYYIFNITGGSQKYINATGKVYFYVDKDLIRYVKIFVEY